MIDIFKWLSGDIFKSSKKDKHECGTVRCYKCNRCNTTLLKRDGKYICKDCHEEVKATTAYLDE